MTPSNLLASSQEAAAALKTSYPVSHCPKGSGQYIRAALQPTEETVYQEKFIWGCAEIQGHQDKAARG